MAQSLTHLSFVSRKGRISAFVNLLYYNHRSLFIDKFRLKGT